MPYVYSSCLFKHFRIPESIFNTFEHKFALISPLSMHSVIMIWFIYLLLDQLFRYAFSNMKLKSRFYFSIMMTECDCNSSKLVVQSWTYLLLLIQLLLLPVLHCHYTTMIIWKIKSIVSLCFQTAPCCFSDRLSYNKSGFISLPDIWFSVAYSCDFKY